MKMKLEKPTWGDVLVLGAILALCVCMLRFGDTVQLRAENERLRYWVAIYKAKAEEMQPKKYVSDLSPQIRQAIEGRQ